MKIPFKVRCLDDVNSRGRLVEGQEYEVSEADVLRYFTNDGRAWWRDRFEIVKQES